MEKEIKAFVCIVEEYKGNKTPTRVFAENEIEARNKLIKMFPKCYVSKAVRFKDYVANKKNIREEDCVMPSCDGAGNCDACYSACEACSVRDIKNMSCMSDAERKMLEARIAELESELIKERKLNRHLTEKIIQMTTK